MSRAVPSADGTLARLQARFLTLLPFIEREARFTFRHLSNFHDREDAIADAVAHAWVLFLRLAEQNTDPTPFPCAQGGFTESTETRNPSRNNRPVPQNHRDEPREVRS